MLKLQVRRNPSSEISTIGNLYYCDADEGLPADWKLLCWTLEDPVREIPGQPVASWKVQDKTAIPVGTYYVCLSMSPHFSAMAGHDVILPEILNVPGFAGVRIHGGNSAADTEGCLLVAHNRLSSDRIQGSAALDVVNLIREHGGLATIEYVACAA